VRIRVLPGTKVTPDTILMDMTDPQLDQELLNAQLQLKSDEVAYHNLQVTLQSALMDKKANAATVNSDYSQAQLQAQTDKQLYQLGVISGLAYNKSKSSADELTTRNGISVEQVDMNAKSIQTQLDVQQAKVDQDKALLRLKEDQKGALEVRAGIDGVLISLGQASTTGAATSDQTSTLGVGAHVAPGTTLATVVVPNQLKAQLKIAETQAHDILLDQPAEIDTHNGIVPGHVTRIDPAVVNGTRTVDVKLDGPLPPGAVPQLSVDGTIDLERLKDVLYVGRPAFGNERSTITLFRFDPDGKTATRVQVKVGSASVTQIQILDGLKEGDRVILSDMSRYDNTDKVRLE
jgi:multidrug resistance efflux pump